MTDLLRAYRATDESILSGCACVVCLFAVCAFGFPVVTYWVGG